MSSIDEVIARSRQPGEFAERKRFTVARQRAIQKMRKFALASPLYYILELIQAAIANGATYVDIDVERTQVFLSYIGGHFNEEELGQLFDFLFASKESLDFADVRQLALGVNALLLAEPAEVIIESGDGTLEGTTRILIDGKSNTVEVGTPTEPLNGTYLRATGLNRAKLGGWLTGVGEPKELHVIEERCLTAPVPIIVNTQPIFGFTSDRTPSIFGVDRAISFDEGDLYGTIGFSEFQGETEVFKLLTWGVWIESVKVDLLPGFTMCGVVNFDRLHKTVDHSAVVQDERLQEMWARLLPYARQLKSGKGGKAVFDISLIDGTKLSATNIRELVKEYGGAVVVPQFGKDDGVELGMARAFGGALDLPVLLRGQDDANTMRLIGGPEARIVEPDVLDTAELAFYRQSPSEPPARPWLTGALDIDPVPVKDLVSVLEREGLLGSVPGVVAARGKQIVSRLRESSEIRATIYTPETPATDAELWVEIWTTDRRLWVGSVQSPFPGHTMVIKLPDISPKVLLDYPWGTADAPLSQLMTSTRTLPRSLAALLANGMSRLAFAKLQGLTERVLASVRHLDADAAAFTGSADRAISRIALAALSRSAIKRLSRDEAEEVRLSFSLLDPKLPLGLLEVPILETLDGASHSARDLEALMGVTGGLVYGVVPGAEPDLDGLDQSRIYRLDLAGERYLIALVGEASYVRVDRRDVIAEFGELRCRDIALGLKDHGDFPLLVEGGDVDAMTDEERLSAESALIVQLVNRFANDEAEEMRRQAARHLIWYLYARHESANSASLDERVATAPLFLDVAGEARSFRELQPLLAREEGVVMHDGWAVDTANLGVLTSSADSPPDDHGHGGVSSRVSLAMNPYVFAILSRVGVVRPALEVDISAEEGSDEEGTVFLSKVKIAEDYVEGEIGVPVVAVKRPAVAVVDRQSRSVSLLLGVARELGVVGRLRLLSPQKDRRQLELLVRRASFQVLEDLVIRLSSLDPHSDEFERCASTVLRFAGHSVQITAEPDGSLVLDVANMIGQQILELPLFATKTGVAMSARRLLFQWISHRNTGDESWRAPLDDDVPEVLRSWIEDLLSDRHVVYPSSGGHAPCEAIIPAPAPTARDDESLSAWLTDTLAHLRSDPVGEEQPTKVVIAYRDGKVMRIAGAVIQGWEKKQLHQFTHLAGRPHLVLDGEHWLVERTRQRAGEDPEAAVWLLLACYAHINDVLEPVTNEHEISFHQQMLELIEEGKLGSWSKA